MSEPMTYARYLALDELLSAQRPLSDCHDELLFIIIHQTKELWLKEIIRELTLARGLVQSGDLEPAYKAMARVSRIQLIMTLSWDVLSTMTPADYLSFRDKLGTSSGFQSYQFRTVEYLLGLKDEQFLKYQPVGSPAYAELARALAEPSLYDAALGELARQGLDVPESVLRRDVSQPYQPSEAVEAAWLAVYRDPQAHWGLYQLAEKLVDIDDALLAWRQKHVLTVERIIGGRPGTGGTEGSGYLARTLQRRCFPELWSLRTKL